MLNAFFGVNVTLTEKRYNLHLISIQIDYFPISICGFEPRSVKLKTVKLVFVASVLST